MDTSIIKRQLHQVIDDLEGKKLKAIYTILEDEIKENEISTFPDEFKAELDRRYDAYKKDKKVINKKAMDNRIKEILKRKK